MSFRLRDVAFGFHQPSVPSGIQSKVSRSPFHKAIEVRDSWIFAVIAMVLIPEAKSHEIEDEGYALELENTVYVLDAMTNPSEHPKKRTKHRFFWFP